MNLALLKSIESFSSPAISDERKEVLQALVQYVQNKSINNEAIRLNFICTHNSRRSHLTQIWAQTMAYYFGIKNIFCYSGGTDNTAIFPKVIETLSNQGFQIQKLTETENPVYAVKYAQNEAPIVCFSKKYNSDFNPKNKFGAILTCDNVDQDCPLVLGAEARISVKYKDPKAYDTTDQIDEKYEECSLLIGQEMYWVFNSIKQ